MFNRLLEFLQRPQAALVLLLVLLGIGLFLRTYDLSVLPNGLYPDEAGNGYQSYSLLKTGADTMGRPWPLMIPYLDGIAIEPLYVYASIPVMALFDLDVFSTRLVASLAGVLTMLGVFLLGRELFDTPTALIAAALTAVSPWLLPFGRIAFGATLMPALVVLGTFCLVRACRDPRWLWAAALCFPLPLYTYAPAKAVVPLLFLTVLFIYRREAGVLLREHRRALIGALLLGALVALPMYLVVLGTGGLRPWNISVFNPNNPYSEGLSPAWLLLKNIFSLLNPLFLFFSGDSNGRHNIPGFGQALTVALPCVLASLVFALRSANQPEHAAASRALRLLCIAFFVGLVPAILTTDGGNPHALRSLSAAPFLELITAAGLMILVRRTPARFKKFAAVLVMLLFCLNGMLYLRAYFGSYRIQSRLLFAYDLSAATRFGLEQREFYDRVIISPGIRHAGLFALFYSRAHPADALAGKEPRGFAHPREFHGKTPPGHTLVIQRNKEMGLQPGHWHHGPDGRPLFNTVEVIAPAAAGNGNGNRRTD